MGFGGLSDCEFEVNGLLWPLLSIPLENPRVQGAATIASVKDYGYGHLAARRRLCACYRDVRELHVGRSA